MQKYLLLLLALAIFKSSFAGNTDNNLVCPDDITIGCCNDYTNTVLTGHPMMMNPSFVSFTYEDELHLNACHEGYIIRTWTGFNGSEYYACEQVINMVYQTDFDGHIQWPPDWQGSCGDQIPMIIPQYDPGFCDMMAHTFHDDTLKIPTSVCFKILRTWKVIDWCKYDPNTGSDEGYWEHIQVLKIVETEKPQFASCSEWEVPAMNDDCTADFTFEKEAIDDNCGVISGLRWQIEFDRGNDWSVDTIAKTEGDKGVFHIGKLAPGTHKIIWKVSDACGNTSQCMELVYVEDGKKPTPFCYLSWPTILMPQGNMLELSASMYMKDALDNCTEKENLIHSWTQDPEDTSRIFDCDDIGFQFLPLYTIDESGNYDFCLVFTRVVTHGDCSPQLVVAGQITDFQGRPVNGIAVMLGTDAINTYPCDTSSAEGTFNFPYVKTIAEPSLYFTQSNGNMYGLTTLDLVILQKYLLGLFKPTDPKAFKLAADMNSDGKVNFYDLHLMRNLILGLELPHTLKKTIRTFVEDPFTPGQYMEVNEVDIHEGDIPVKVIRVGDLSGF